MALADYIRNIPPVTRFFTVSSLIVCALQRAGLLDVTTLSCSVQDFQEPVNRFLTVYYGWKSTKVDIVIAFLQLCLQCYRFVFAFLPPASLFHSPVSGYGLVLDIYLFYNFAKHLESKDGKFKGNFPDCAWFTFLTGTIIVLTTYVVSYFNRSFYPCYHPMMVAAVTYLWSRESKNSTISFMTVLPIKAYFLPLFSLVMKYITDDSQFYYMIIGFWGAYIYQCIQSQTIPIYNLLPNAYPSSLTVVKGRSLNAHNSIEKPFPDSIFDKGYLKAPIWLYNLLGYPTNNSVRTTAFHSHIRSASNSSTASGNERFSQSPNRYFKGRGHRLGN